MLSSNYRETKLQLIKLGKMNRDLEKLMKECIRNLDEVVEYEKLFGNKQPKVLSEAVVSISQNTREIVEICTSCVKNQEINLTADNIAAIEQKLSDNDTILSNFRALLRSK